MEENAVLSYLKRRLKQPDSLDPTWLLTMFSVWELERYPLEAWNEALSAVLGRKVWCPSYRTLSRRLEEAALEYAEKRPYGAGGPS